MITFTEYLNEAYTSDMKKEISQQDLQAIGNILAKKHNISVQDTDFMHLKKGWKKADVEGHRYAIWQFTDDTVALSGYQEFSNKGPHKFYYPDNKYGEKADIASLKKETKNVWVFDKILGDTGSNRVWNKQYNRYISQQGGDKLDAVRNKVNKLSPTGMYQRVKKLVESYGLKLLFAYNNGPASIRVNIAYPDLPSGINCGLHYDAAGGWYADLSYDRQADEFDEFKKVVDKMHKLVSELEKLDMSELPSKN